MSGDQSESVRHPDSADLPTPVAIAEWTPLLYAELRNIARRERFRVSGGETLATTALVNEAYLRMRNTPGFGSRGQFLGTAAMAMRCILVDRVRAQLAAKRGGGIQKLPLDEDIGFVVDDEEVVLSVHNALDALSTLSPRLARVVECRFFAGYDEGETAEALGLSRSTVKRDWVTARVWLRRELSH